MVAQLVPATRPAAPQRYPLPWNATSTLPAATNAEYFYDYAGQDPINNYDLSGDSACSSGGWLAWSGICHPLRPFTHPIASLEYTGHQIAAGAKWLGRGAQGDYRGLVGFFRAARRHPGDFAAGVVGVIGGTFMGAVTIIATGICEGETDGIGTLDCYKIATFGYAGTTGMLSLGVYSFRQMYRRHR